MKKTIFTASIITFSLVSCNKTENNNSEHKVDVVKEIIPKTENPTPKSTEEEGKIIKPFEVVHVSATQKQIDSLTQGLDEEDFSVLTDDAYYYTAQAQKYLDSMKIKTVNVDAGKKLIFVSKTGKKYPYKTKVTVSEFILFNGESKPEVADMVSIDRHIEKLYHKTK